MLPEIGDLIAYRKGEKLRLGTVTGFANFQGRSVVLVNGKRVVYLEEIEGVKKIK